MINIPIVCTLTIWLFGSNADSPRPIKRSGKVNNACNDTN
jgi:hypothetical protein